MKAEVYYDDFIGSAAADISDFLATNYGEGIQAFGKYFEVDLERFQIVGLVFNGEKNPALSLLCLDKLNSTGEKDHIVKMSIGSNFDMDTLFKSFEIVLYPRFDRKYSELYYDEEVGYDDCHEENQ